MITNDIRAEKNVIIGNIEKYKNWICGNFKPSILETRDFEVGIFNIPKGHISDGHKHSFVIELNIIIAGECTVICGGIKHKLKNGDTFMYPPNVPSNVEYTKDTTLVVVKTPSLNDKYYSQKEDDEG